MGVARPRGLDNQSPREGMSSGGEDDEEEPWSAREVELLEALVRNFGRLLYDTSAGWCCFVLVVLVLFCGGLA